MKNVSFLQVLLFLAVCIPAQLSAQWSTVPDVNNNLNASKPNPGTGFSSCPDGSGGAFYAFVKTSVSDGNPDVFVNRIDKNGVVKWGSGINVNETADNQVNPVICEDGHGGCYVAYENTFSIPGFPVLVQHFDSAGNKLWAGNGVRALTIPNGLGQSAASLSNDDGNGVFVTVQNTVFGGADGIHSQKLNFDGLLQWGADGSRVILPFYERNPQTIADGSGGVMIIWFSNYQLRAQRLNAGGVRQYDTANYFLNTVTTGGDYKLIKDAANQFIAVWSSDSADGNGYNIYAQKINIAGTKLWGSVPAVICNATGAQYIPSLISDNNGGAYVSWLDGRGSPAGYYAQRVNANGVRQWLSQGIPLYTSGAINGYNCMVPDINNGAKVFFEAISTGTNVSMQSLNMDGSKNTPAQGIIVASSNGSLPANRGAVALPNGEAIVFTEAFTGVYNLYAKKVPQGCMSAKPVTSNVTTTCGPNSATLKWQGHLFSTFNVRYKIASASSWTTIGNVGRVTSYTFSNLQANTAYKFQVRAACNLSNTFSPWANRNKTTQNCLMAANIVTGTADAITVHENIVMSIYPNPATKNCIVQFTANSNGQLKVFDMNGHVKYQTVVNAKQQQQVIDVSAFNAGVYICRLISGDKIYSAKLVVVR